MKIIRWILLGLTGVVLLPWQGVAKDSDDVILRQQLDGLRGVRVPGKTEQAKFDELNQRMDAAWTFVAAHKATALPVVEAELRKAIGAEVPDQFFLLDISFLLVTHRGNDAAELALSGVARLDPKADIIQANWEELFHLMMKLGASGVTPERYFTEVDRIYLKSDAGVDFFLEPHVVQLNGSDLRCMMYGVAGDRGAAHLAALLSHSPGDPNEIIRTLEAIGSETYVPQVATIMTAAKDFKTMGSCITYMMQVGGPSGRSAVLALDVRSCDAATKEYFKKIYPEVKKVSFAVILSRVEADDKVTESDAKLQRLLDAMEEHDGADYETSPAALLKSGIPPERMLAQLKRIRARSFRRETNHVFEDLPVFNILINALQFKLAKS